jgi:hypothetical protein
MPISLAFQVSGRAGETMCPPKSVYNYIPFLTHLPLARNQIRVSKICRETTLSHHSHVLTRLVEPCASNLHHSVASAVLMKQSTGIQQLNSTTWSRVDHDCQQKSMLNNLACIIPLLLFNTYSRLLEALLPTAE